MNISPDWNELRINLDGDKKIIIEKNGTTYTLEDYIYKLWKQAQARYEEEHLKELLENAAEQQKYIEAI